MGSRSTEPPELRFRPILPGTASPISPRSLPPIVSLSILLAVGGLALVQYLVPWQVREQHNDVAGFIYAVLGVLYAVLLGFVTISVWEDFEVARITAENEANE